MGGVAFDALPNLATKRIISVLLHSLCWLRGTAQSGQEVCHLRVESLIVSVSFVLWVTWSIAPALRQIKTATRV